MKRKMLSILLALVMVCSLLPVTAMAAGAPEFGYAVLPISYAETFGKIEVGKELPALDDVIIEDSADYALCMKDDSGKDLDISSISFEWWYEDSSWDLVKVPDGHIANTEDGYYLRTVVETEQAYTVTNEYAAYDNVYLMSGSLDYAYHVSDIYFLNSLTRNSLEIYFYCYEPLADGTVADKNGMAYYYDDYEGSFVIWGEYLKNWKQTSCVDYYSYLVEGEYEYESDAYNFEYDSSNGLISETENLDAKIKITPVDGQQLLEISYTVINTSESEKNYAVGTTVDVQIGENDGAVITPFTDGKAGFKMLEGGPLGAQFNFFGNDVTSFWYGPYSAYSYYFVDGYEEFYNLSGYLNENVTNVSGWSGDYFSSHEDSIFKSQKRDSLNADSMKEIIKDHLGITVEDIYLDSAASWRWEGTLAVDEEVTHSVYIGIGEVGSDDDVVIPGDNNTPAPIPTYYDLWIGGVQVSDANKDDLVTAINREANDTVATGEATYDPDTETLTFTNFQYTGEHENGSDYETSAISVKEDGITIVFSGENMIEGTGDCGLYADVEDHIRLKAADKNSTLTFTCENGNAFLHIPELVEIDIDIYAGSSEADAAAMELDAFAESPHPYDFKYVKFVPATPTPPTATDTDTPEAEKPVIKPTTTPSYDPTPVIPPANVDVHDDTLYDAAQAVYAAVKSGKADFTPIGGYTNEDVIRMQKDDALKLVVEKKRSYDPAEKSLIDKSVEEKVKGALVQFLEIDVTLRTMADVIVAEVDDTIVPLSITVELDEEMQRLAKDGKTIYVARAHDGKVAFLEGTLNADKTKVTFDSSKFSTYALVAFDSKIVTAPQTADAGIFLAVSMSVLSVTGSAVLLKKKED